MRWSWSAVIGLILMNAVLGAAAVHWGRRARASRGGDAPRWHQLEALAMTTVAVMFLAALDLFVLAGASGPAWLKTAGQVVVVGGSLTAAVLWITQRLLQTVEDRQDRRLRVTAGLPVHRRLWHPLAVALAWLAGIVPATWLLGHVTDWAVTRYFGDRFLSVEENARLTDTLTGGFAILAGLYALAAVSHVAAQVIRRRRDRRRVAEQERHVLADMADLTPLPPVWLPAALAGSGDRWRWALRHPLTPDEEPPALRAAPPLQRWGYLAALTVAFLVSLTLWSLTTVGIVTASGQPAVGRVVLLLAWVGVTAGMTNAGGPDLVRVLRGVVRAVLAGPGPAGPARP